MDLQKLILLIKVSLRITKAIKVFLKLVGVTGLEPAKLPGPKPGALPPEPHP